VRLDFSLRFRDSASPDCVERSVGGWTLMSSMASGSRQPWRALPLKPCHSGMVKAGIHIAKTGSRLKTMALSKIDPYLPR
jgi:hypothetical protein